VRDVILFFSGLAGLWYELIVVPSPNPAYLVLIGGMLGLPVFLRKDEA
jgi:xanthosine utilization system XapX-like protein